MFHRRNKQVNLSSRAKSCIPNGKLLRRGHYNHFNKDTPANVIRHMFMTMCIVRSCPLSDQKKRLAVSVAFMPMETQALVVASVGSWAERTGGRTGDAHSFAAIFFSTVT